MPDIVGIRFKKAGKVYYFDPAAVELKVNDFVVVQTARGVEMGEVTIAPKQVLANEVTGELKPIVRKATPEDIKRAQDFASREASAMVECQKMVAKLKLPMKLVEAEYNLDGTRLTFYFTSEERVDFRDLVRELTAFFRTRIELRQIGPRDQAKIVGGLGRCGRALCCGSFLTEFSPVSIKMAKEQDLPLDPMKISGVCGRLQCCLSYESAQYKEAKAAMPRRGQPVITPSGPGVITNIFPLKETVVVEFESQASAEFPVSEIKLAEIPRPHPVEAAKPVNQETVSATPQGKDQPAEVEVPEKHEPETNLIIVPESEPGANSPMIIPDVAKPFVAPTETPPQQPIV
jgi:cell fate regulator YaaT (PSP1 superfamily)